MSLDKENIIIDPTIFHAYDVRGVYPEQINPDVVYRIAQAYAKFIQPETVALGRDVRLSGPVLFEAMKNGFIDHGVNVIDIGEISTDMYNFASGEYGYDALTITASHNPREYNGIKMSRKNAVPISGDSGINDIKQLVLSGYAYKASKLGKVTTKDILDDYLEKCLSFVDRNKIKPLKVVANGMFGLAIQNLKKLNLPLEIIPLNEIPDGSFPKGPPDPFLKENRTETEELIKKEKVDMGVAWDGDADRFFLFDENARLIPGYYLTAFLGEYFCRNHKGAKIVYEPRGTWAVVDAVNEAGGVSLLNKVGHSFIKERMRKEDAVFGGEGSGHFYFNDFYYADNGLIPFLLLLQIISESNKKVSELFDDYFKNYFISGEINTDLKTFEDADKIFRLIETQFKDAKIDHTDGVSVEYNDWRANVRSSNTQPLIRLNVEAKTEDLMNQKTQEFLGLIRK
ncbi:MAG: phosphomannomutase/phosphoglucomutase [Candidatus Paceibacterota bacterium]